MERHPIWLLAILDDEEASVKDRAQKVPGTHL